MDIKPDKNELDAIETSTAPAAASLEAGNQTKSLHFASSLSHADSALAPAVGTSRQRSAPEEEPFTPRKRARREAPARSSATRASARNQAAAASRSIGPIHAPTQAQAAADDSSELSDIEEGSDASDALLECTQAVHHCEGQAPLVQGEYCTVFGESAVSSVACSVC